MLIDHWYSREFNPEPHDCLFLLLNGKDLQLETSILTKSKHIIKIMTNESLKEMFSNLDLATLKKIKQNQEICSLIPKTSVDHLNEQINESNRITSALQNSPLLQQLKKKLDDVCANLEKVKEENKELKDKLVGASTNIEKLKGELVGASTNIENLKEENKELKEELVGASTNIEKLKEENEELKNKFNDICKYLDKKGL